MMRQAGLFIASDDCSLPPLAKLSDDLQYRYFLSRQWDVNLPAIAFIGLNPSTADAHDDDPTIRRCVSFAKTWGGGALWMVNLFGFRSTDPRNLLNVHDPIGPDNDHWIEYAVSRAYFVVAAWGNRGNILDRATSITSRYRKNLKALQVTKAGMPKHPLYVRADTIPNDWHFVQRELNAVGTR